MASIKLYKLNLTEEEKIIAYANYHGEDSNNDEVIKEAKNYEPTDGGGMCWGCAQSMLLSLADDWYLILYDEDRFMPYIGDGSELEQCYEYLGIEAKRATLVFYQEDI